MKLDCLILAILCGMLADDKDRGLLISCYYGCISIIIALIALIHQFIG